MGIGDLNDSKNPEILINSGDKTIDELINLFGKGSVMRGLSYMRSLEKADEEYRKSITGGYEDSMKNMADVEELSEDGQEAVDQWKEAMENKGLGVNDE